MSSINVHLHPIFVPYLHRNVTKQQVVNALSDAFRKKVVSSIYLVMKTGLNGINFQIAFIRFNNNSDEYTAQEFNRALVSNRILWISYYCPLFKCHRRFECVQQTNPHVLENYFVLTSKL
jgi:RNA recognition motif-containing protein